MKDLYLSQLIDKLTAIYLMQGIQPSELADAIFDEPYTSIVSNKYIDSIEVILTFKEYCDITNKEHTRSIKYLYNFDRYLIQISESLDSKTFKITWDRENTLNTIINDIKQRLSLIGYNTIQIEKFLTTLPSPPKNKSLSKKLSLAS
ncbi:hypothetical protein HGO21_30790 [Acinetobacter sp. CUI P1]|uniref:hypothetical protein n=1 Tax=Acinetobacter junii TaxID=40215 RepID=UPI00057A5B3D|nr:hypothetical protein [Acinetobacter junii]MBY3623908.1 hypothetical protein [Acinetobacter sp. CUI P1]